MSTARGPASALAGRTFRDARVLTIAFAYVFAVYSFAQPVGYRHAYPTTAGRLAFVDSFAGNTGLRLLYGAPRAVQTTAGYTAWRVGGTLAIAAAAYGALAAVRALRGEEEAGRTELVLAGPVSRHAAYGAAMTALAGGTALLWLGEFAGFAFAGLALPGSALLALATASVVPVFAGVGALASQLVGTRRAATQLSGAAVVLFLLVRTVADTTGGAAWLRWATPLGWAENLRPFTGARPAVLLLPLAAGVVLHAAAARISLSRDLGGALLRAADRSQSRFGLLSSPAAQALRSQRDGLVTWAGSVALFAFVLGVVSGSVSSAGISSGIDRRFGKLGAGSIVTPTGYLSFVFLLFMLAVSLFACVQVGTARREEADQRLETLLALPVGRTRWLVGRLALAAGAMAALALASGLFTWAGAAAAGVDVSLPRLLEAGANCLPVALLFLGIAALAYAAVPRAAAGIAYGTVTAAFLWQTVGSLLGAPTWLVDLTPFAHVGLVPSQAFRAVPAAIMSGTGVAAAVTALAAFRRRDLLGA